MNFFCGFPNLKIQEFLFYSNFDCSTVIEADIFFNFLYIFISYYIKVEKIRIIVKQINRYIYLVQVLSWTYGEKNLIITIPHAGAIGKIHLIVYIYIYMQNSYDDQLILVNVQPANWFSCIAVECKYLSKIIHKIQTCCSQLKFIKLESVAQSSQI